MKKIALLLFIIILAVAAVFFTQKFRTGKAANITENNQTKVATSTPVITDHTVKIPITTGTTFGALMQTSSSSSYAEAMEIYAAAKPVYDLVNIRAGKDLELTYDNDTNELEQLKYDIDSDNELSVRKICTTTPLTATSTATLATGSAATMSANATSTRSASSTVTAASTPGCYWLSRVAAIPYEIKIRTASGTVETSMYQAALDNNIDIRAIIELANVFQWSIDFAMDPRQGDTFKFIYEERYLDGKYVMPGRILAGQYVNDGEKYQAYYFEESADNKGYFDENGNSVQKMFLKAPVEFKYISSGYTTGNRVVMELGMSGPHEAIDYAAALGTPIRAVGDGTVTFAGWNSGGYGNFTIIRHNATYTTRYAHQSKILVKVGQKVKQGQVIGLVGSTGNSTGPHLHFEMLKNGVKINPLKEVLPPGKPIKDADKAKFFAAIKQWQDTLNQK